MPGSTRPPRKGRLSDSASAWLTPEGVPATPAFFLAIQSDVVGWWAQHRRRDLPWRPHCASLTQLQCDPYQIWVSEVMSQQTRMDTVIRYFPAWMAAFPTIEHVASASEDDVRKVWAGLGFYRRAQMLRRGAQYIVEQHRMKDKDGRATAEGAAANGEAVKMPGSYAELLKVPGIGPYTAAAVASVCYGEPVASVDGNLIRVLSRLRAEHGVDPKRPANVRAAFAWGQELMNSGTESLGVVCRHPGALNQGLMELGASICRPNGPPLCEECPIRAHCSAYALQQRGLLPVIDGVIPMRGSKTKVRDEHVLCVVHEVVRGGSEAQRRFLVVKRPEDGLLGGMLEFPGLVSTDTPLVPAAGVEEETTTSPRHSACVKEATAVPTQWEKDALRCLSLHSAVSTLGEACGKVSEPAKMGEVHHIFSHIDMRVTVYHVQWHLTGSDADECVTRGGPHLAKGATTQAEHELCLALASALDRAGDDVVMVTSQDDGGGDESSGEECVSPPRKRSTVAKVKARGKVMATGPARTIDRISIMTELELRGAAPSRLCLKILQLVHPEGRAGAGASHRSATSPTREAAKTSAYGRDRRRVR